MGEEGEVFLVCRFVSESVSSAFTRTDLLTTLAVIIIVGFLGFRSLGNSRSVKAAFAFQG